MADIATHTVQVFSTTGAWRRQLAAGLLQPVAIALALDEVLVADSGTRSLWAFRRDGSAARECVVAGPNPLRMHADSGEFEDREVMDVPTGAAAAEDGELFVSDIGRHCVHVFV